MATVERPTTGALVWRLSMKWRARVDRAVEPFGLTHATYTVLASLFGLTRRGEAPRQRELAELTGLDPVYISKLVRTLERDGFVDRAVHPEDPRAVALSLTPVGRRTVTGAVDAVQHLLDELTAPLGGRRSARVRELDALLHALLDG